MTSIFGILDYSGARFCPKSRVFFSMVTYIVHRCIETFSGGRLIISSVQFKVLEIVHSN
jgi:hypothetical protein